MIAKIKPANLGPGELPVRSALILILLISVQAVFAQSENSFNGLQQGVGPEPDYSVFDDDSEDEDALAYNDDIDYEDDDESDDDESDIEANLLPSLASPAAASGPPARTGNGLQQNASPSARDGNGLQLRSSGGQAERRLSFDEAMRTLGGAGFLWDPFFGTGNISFAGHHAAFSTGYPGEQIPVLLDSREILTLSAPHLENGLLRFPESFVNGLKRAFDSPSLNEQSRYRIAAIVVDPGHGGKDPGAQSTHRINGKNVQVS
jgi:N-acetylmuramoyl-L-alanine amidase